MSNMIADLNDSPIASSYGPTTPNRLPYESMSIDPHIRCKSEGTKGLDKSPRPFEECVMANLAVPSTKYWGHEVYNNLPVPYPRILGSHPVQRSSTTTTTADVHTTAIMPTDWNNLRPLAPAGVPPDQVEAWRVNNEPDPTVVRAEEDRKILEGKGEGLSYREIKKKYALGGAVSTLRGRYRALTKSREERIRKPWWTQHDVSLCPF